MCLWGSFKYHILVGNVVANVIVMMHEKHMFLILYDATDLEKYTEILSIKTCATQLENCKNVMMTFCEISFTARRNHLRRCVSNYNGQKSAYMSLSTSYT